MLPLLVDQDNLPLAYFTKNLILQVSTGNILGIVLGQCVYSNAGKAVGRLFHGILRNERGEQVALLTTRPNASLPAYSPEPPNERIWEVLHAITDHSCLQHVPENRHWSDSPLEKLLPVQNA